MSRPPRRPQGDHARHVPVLLAEVLASLDLSRAGLAVDGTFGPAATPAPCSTPSPTYGSSPSIAIRPPSPPEAIWCGPPRDGFAS